MIATGVAPGSGPAFHFAETFKMNMPLVKTERSVAAALPHAEVLRITPPKPDFLRTKLLPALSNIAANVLPPPVMPA